MVKVLLVGQVPPPHVGQFIMIEKMMNAQYRDIQILPLRMHFSKEVDDIGKFSFGKVVHLIGTILRIWYSKARFRPDVLYYPPAGPNMVPVCRDILILLSTRWLFKNIVFHFHAGGISEVYVNLTGIKKWLFRKAYFNVDLAIRLAADNPEDGVLLEAKKNVVIPYGIRDVYSESFSESTITAGVPQLLFLGMLRETKGLFVFLEACNLLKSKGLEFSARLVGGFISLEERDLAIQYIDHNGLDDLIEIAGVLTGSAKWDAYRDADIFCMPSHYEAETFGLVAVEAMQFKLPVVATRWRGLQSIVLDGVTGFLVPIQDSEFLSQKLAYLIENGREREEMGENSRERYLKDFTEKTFIESFEREILCLG